jgi:hypothetical protein
MMSLVPDVAVELGVLRAQLLALHAPVRTGPYQPNPYREPVAPAGRLVCAGCGGVMWWPCATRRILDGHPVEAGAVAVVGAPWREADGEDRVGTRLATVRHADSTPSPLT